MGLSDIQVKQIKEDFEKKYFFSDPYKVYVNGCGISNLEVMQHTRQEKIDLKHGESLEDLCLRVMLRKIPPKDLEFPTEYNGVRVFYQVVGKIRPQ